MYAVALGMAQILATNLHQAIFRVAAELADQHLVAVIGMPAVATVLQVM
jgi:hypothetical protein